MDPPSCLRFGLTWPTILVGFGGEFKLRRWHGQMASAAVMQ
jgi:hypothetical protein